MDSLRMKGLNKGLGLDCNKKWKISKWKISMKKFSPSKQKLTANIHVVILNVLHLFYAVCLRVARRGNVSVMNKGVKDRFFQVSLILGWSSSPLFSGYENWTPCWREGERVRKAKKPIREIITVHSILVHSPSNPKTTCSAMIRVHFKPRFTWKLLSKSSGLPVKNRW